MVTITSSPPSLAIIDNSIQQQQQQGHELITAAADMEMEEYELLMEMSTCPRQGLRLGPSEIATR